MNSTLIALLQGAKGVGSELYSATKDGINKTIDVVNVQAPEIINQFLKWKMAESLIHVGCMLVAFFVIFYFTHKIHKELKSSGDYRSGEATILIPILLTILLIFIGTFIYVDVIQVVKIYVAPKIYILEWVTENIKNLK